MEMNVDNMEQNAELFVEKMGFAHDSAGLDMTEEQLVNFLLICHQMEYGVGEESEDEMQEDSDIKVKVIKLKGGDMSSIMDEMLGHGGPKMESNY
tara:strand:- start:4671 stop:4955 length:285 start_codon:yes stop_codon:yes gene_type:complete